MKKLFNILVILIIYSSSASAQFKKPQRSNEPLTIPLTVTHLLPSALPLPGGMLMLGTTSGVGFLDVFDVTTNLYLDIQQILNVNVKVNLYRSPNYAFGLFAGYVSQTARYNYYDAALVQTVQVSTNTTSITPGAVFSYRLTPRLIGHAGGHLSIRRPEITKSSIIPSRTALVQGNTLNKEFSYSINKTVALSLGGSYDLTYDIWGVGSSVHVGGFQLGVHYYLNVQEGSVLPLLGGSYTSSLD